MALPIKTITLVKIGAIGGVITVTTGLALQWKLNMQVKRTEYYQEAIKTLKFNKAAVYLLGEPIKEGRIDVGDTTNNYAYPHSAKFVVPLKGSKQKGTMYFWANKSPTTDKWIVNRIELGLANETNKRLLVKLEQNQ